MFETLIEETLPPHSILHPNHFLLIGAKEKLITGLKLELRRMRGGGGRDEAELRTKARLSLEEQEGCSVQRAIS